MTPKIEAAAGDYVTFEGISFQVSRRNIFTYSVELYPRGALTYSLKTLTLRILSQFSERWHWHNIDRLILDCVSKP